MEPKEWLGVETHLQVRGTLNGETLSLESDSADVSLACERIYELPRSGLASKGRLRALVIRANADVGGEARGFELELRGTDLQRVVRPSDLAIVPRLQSRPLVEGEANVRWTWYLRDGEHTLLFSEAAQDGRFTLQELSGAPGANGFVIPSGEGAAGGLLEARWTEFDALRLSFTAPCAVSRVEELDL